MGRWGENRAWRRVREEAVNSCPVPRDSQGCGRRHRPCRATEGAGPWLPSPVCAPRPRRSHAQCLSPDSHPIELWDAQITGLTSPHHLAWQPHTSLQLPGPKHSHHFLHLASCSVPFLDMAPGLITLSLAPPHPPNPVSEEAGTSTSMT